MLAAGFDIRDRAATVFRELSEPGLGVTRSSTIGSKLHAQCAVGVPGCLRLPHCCSPFSRDVSTLSQISAGAVGRWSLSACMSSRHVRTQRDRGSQVMTGDLGGSGAALAGPGVKGGECRAFSTVLPVHGLAARLARRATRNTLARWGLDHLGETAA